MADKKSANGSSANSERNSLQQARPRGRKRPPVKSADRQRGSVNSLQEATARRATVDGAKHSVQASGSVRRDKEEERLSEKSARSTHEADKVAGVPDSQAVPEHIRRRFVQVGRKYYFPDGARAFTDRGRRLTTASENTEVIASLVDIAKLRGWREISVRGTERFRREAWQAAKKVGLDVRGYRASSFEESKLVRTLAQKDTAERRTAAPPEQRERDGESTRTKSAQFTGKLLEHGRAPYQQNPKEPMSYYVRLATARGDRTIWGVDLERAFKESITQPKTGDEVTLVPGRQDPVNITVPEHDAEGKVSGQRRLATHRNRWVIEQQSFFDDRAQVARTLLDQSVSPRQGAKSHPELIGTYLQVRAAELASKQIKDPSDRRAFVDRVRGVLAEAIARGEALPKVHMKDKTRPLRAPRAPEPTQVR